MNNKNELSAKFKLWNVYLFIVVLFGIKTITENIFLGIVSILCAMALYSYIHKVRIMNHQYWQLVLVTFSAILVYKTSVSFYYLLTGKIEMFADASNNELIVVMSISIFTLLLIQFPQLYALVKLSLNRVIFSNEMQSNNTNEHGSK